MLLYVISGSGRIEVSAALWTNSDPESIQKVAADPNPALHVVCIEQSRVHASFVLDGRQRLDRWVRAVVILPRLCGVLAGLGGYGSAMVISIAVSKAMSER